MLNPNRNSDIAGDNRELLIEQEFAAFGIDRVIWLEGDVFEPITNGHVDGYIMLAGGESMLFETIEGDRPLSRKADLAVLQQARTTGGDGFRIEQVNSPREAHVKLQGPYCAPCYLNAYLANGAVIAALFGDSERDDEAKDRLAQAFPDRILETLKLTTLPLEAVAFVV